MTTLADPTTLHWTGPSEAVTEWTTDWAEPGPFTRVVPSWEVTGADWVDLEVQVRSADGRTSDWSLLAHWHPTDPARTTRAGQQQELSSVDDDTLLATPGTTLDAVRLRIRAAAPVVVRRLHAAIWTPGEPRPTSAPLGPGLGISLRVPTLSQQAHRDHHPQWGGGGQNWCSAASTAMVLAWWGLAPTPDQVAWTEEVWPVGLVDEAARACFDAGFGGTGNWAFNTAWAASVGAAAMVTRYRDLTDLEPLIAAGVPVIVSVAFEREDLDGAGYRTDGHLLVVVGFTRSGDVVVNDPNAHGTPRAGQVRTVYRRDQFERVWARAGSGLAYLITPPDHPLGSH